jgi:hypothetical protein
MVTGRDNMKTYQFTTKATYTVDPILRNLDILFVRERVGDDSTYLIDLETTS